LLLNDSIYIVLIPLLLLRLLYDLWAELVFIGRQDAGQRMGFEETYFSAFCYLLLFSVSWKCQAAELDMAQTAVLEVDASWNLSRKIPDTLFGLFFEVRLCLFSFWFSTSFSHHSHGH
jgi:hypothetical protein